LFGGALAARKAWAQGLPRQRLQLGAGLFRSLAAPRFNSDFMGGDEEQIETERGLLREAGSIAGRACEQGLRGWLCALKSSFFTEGSKL